MSRGENPRSHEQGERNLQRMKLVWQPDRPRTPAPAAPAHNSNWRAVAAANIAAAKNKKAKAEREADAWMERVKARKAARK